MDLQNELQEKLNNKIDKELEDLKEELMNSKPQVIIERAYELTIKEEMTYKIKDKDYSVNELKALLKNKNILNECYEEWLESDENINEMLEDVVVDRIEEIVNDYKKDLKRNKESR